jgi:hypothetical protein
MASGAAVLNENKIMKRYILLSAAFALYLKGVFAINNSQ